MAKKIDRSRIEAGKVELPKKLAFLTTDKIDYLAVHDRDGEFSVELPAAALAKLVKANSELKVLKGEMKTIGKMHADALTSDVLPAPLNRCPSQR